MKVRESLPKGFMIVAAVSYLGKLKLVKVQKNVKINSVYYSNKVLKPVFKEISLLYQKKDHRFVWYHQDRASSHFSAKTVQTLLQLNRKYGINFIPKEDIPVKSPDIAPIDFCIFRLLKQALWSRSAQNFDELWKITKQEWRKLSIIKIRNALMSWKYLCRLVVKRSGRHIENVLH